jgi:hypothetical protein
MDRNTLLRVVEDAVHAAEELSKRYVKASVALSVIEADCAMRLKMRAREAAHECAQANETPSERADYSKVVERMEGLSLEPFREFVRSGIEVGDLLDRFDHKRRVALKHLKNS